jgi:hypothetical protein
MHTEEIKLLGAAPHFQAIMQIHFLERKMKVLYMP